MDAIDLSIFSSRVAAVCEEMGAVLRRTAFSPNIRDRLDFSCALFDADGELLAQAAHIPVHLGSMAYAMREIVHALPWREGDVVIVNDPYLGGTHLPDVTVIAPAFVAGRLIGFAANRAHHADIGAVTPGSMPLSRRLEEEGVVIAPTHLYRGGVLDQSFFDALVGRMRDTRQAAGDFAAQASAVRTGVRRFAELATALGVPKLLEAMRELNDYAERLMRASLDELPHGIYRFVDVLDDDGQGRYDVPIVVTLRVGPEGVEVDFDGTAEQVSGNINCPLSVAAAAVFYVFRCLAPEQLPVCAGAFRPIRLRARLGSLVNAQRPAAVAAGNVETSTRIVDTVLGALAAAVPDRVAAASHGSMNNLAMGGEADGRAWDYYETLAGGMGAGRDGGGVDCVHTHMTNTLNTPLEALEMHYPLRVRRYARRTGSGGSGMRRGGDGIVREYEFLVPATVTLLTERRRHAPWGLAGGEPGLRGRNLLNGRELPGKATVEVRPGDRLTVETPGGGGYGSATN